MGYKSSTVPNYRRCTLRYNIGNVPVNTDIGFRYVYTADFDFIPIYSVNIESNSPIRSSISDSYFVNWSNINPSVDSKFLNVTYRPTISTLTSTIQTYDCLIENIEGNNLVVRFYWRKSSNSSKYLECHLLYTNSVSTSGTGSKIRLYGQYDSTSDSDEAAIAKMNSILSSAEFYIGGSTQCSSGTSIMTMDNSLYLYVVVGNNVAWGPSQVQSGISAPIYVTVSDDTEKYIPEPAPPSPQPSTDPYSPGGYSTGGGGNGSYDTSSDPIPIPGLPANIATGTGLFTAYNPDASQLANFASKLWNKDPTTIDDWFRMLFGGDAFNAIIGLMMVPVQPSTGSNKNILLGNWDTGASAPVISSQYVDVNFGSLTLDEFWGNSIDYSPYTRVQLALPYIGIVDIDTDDVIGSVNTLSYHIDVFSGALCAMLHCVKGNLSSVIYQWSGSCGVALPITGQNFNAVIGAVMGVGAAALGGIAMASGPIGAAIGTAGSLAVGTGAVTGAAANMFGTMKGKVQKSGSFSASSGALGIMTPYFIITRPVQSVPSTQQATKGYPANISAHLGDLLGYTELEEVHLHNIPGTKDEVLEIESLLKKGVIF